MAEVQTSPAESSTVDEGALNEVPESAVKSSDSQEAETIDVKDSQESAMTAEVQQAAYSANLVVIEYVPKLYITSLFLLAAIVFGFTYKLISKLVFSHLA